MSITDCFIRSVISEFSPHQEEALGTKLYCQDVPRDLSWFGLTTSPENS